MDDDNLDALLDDAADDVLSNAAATATTTTSDNILDDVLSSLQQSHTQAPPNHGMLRVPQNQNKKPSPRQPPTIQELLTTVFPSQVAGKWINIIEKDEPLLKEDPRYMPRPLSNSYQGESAGGGIGLLIGKKKKRTLAAGAGGGKEEEEEEEEEEEGGEDGGGGSKKKKPTQQQGQGQGPASLLPELILRAASSAGIRDTEPLRKELKTNTEATERLQALFLQQMVKDLKPLVEEDTVNFDPERFPATAAHVLK